MADCVASADHTSLSMPRGYRELGVRVGPLLLCPPTLRLATSGKLGIPKSHRLRDRARYRLQGFLAFQAFQELAQSPEYMHDDGRLLPRSNDLSLPDSKIGIKMRTDSSTGVSDTLWTRETKQLVLIPAYRGSRSSSKSEMACCYSQAVGLPPQYQEQRLAR